jgi:hypothetical protein
LIEIQATTIIAPSIFLVSPIQPPTMAPSTPKKSHQMTKKRRAEVTADARNTRQDAKSTPMRSKTKQHPNSLITQQDDGGPSDASSFTLCFTPSPSIAYSSLSNAGIESLINCKGHVGNTKPVEITEFNILGWF